MVSAGGPPRPQVNEVGDVVLDNARQLRAPADRVALGAFTWLQRHGPATAGQVATELERVLMPYLNRAADDCPPTRGGCACWRTSCRNPVDM